MRRTLVLFVTVLALMSVVGGGAARGLAQTQTDSAAIDDIRTKLLHLPYYGVFDFLAFSYEKGTVTLSGANAAFSGSHASISPSPMS